MAPNGGNSTIFQFAGEMFTIFVQILKFPACKKFPVSSTHLFLFPTKRKLITTGISKQSRLIENTAVRHACPLPIELDRQVNSLSFDQEVLAMQTSVAGFGPLFCYLLMLTSFDSCDVELWHGISKHLVWDKAYVTARPTHRFILVSLCWSIFHIRWFAIFSNY